MHGLSVFCVCLDRLCRAYRSVNGEWKERGTGQLRALCHPETKKVRLVLRQQKTLKLALNQYVASDIELRSNAGSDRTWTYVNVDFSENVEEGERFAFALKFKSPDIANDFKELWAQWGEGNVDEALKAASQASTTPAQDAAATKVTLWDAILKENGLQALSQEQLRAAWDAYDKDGSGEMDASELSALVSDIFDAMFKGQDTEVTEEVKSAVAAQVPALAQDILTALDTNQDGKLSWAEFSARLL